MLFVFLSVTRLELCSSSSLDWGRGAIVFKIQDRLFLILVNNNRLGLHGCGCSFTVLTLAERLGRKVVLNIR